VENTVTQAAAVLKQQLSDQEVSSDYYDLIMDHDYCVNVPPPKDDSAHIIYADPNDLGDSAEVMITDTPPIVEEVVETAGTEETWALNEPQTMDSEPVEEPQKPMEIVPKQDSFKDLIPVEEERGLRLEDLDFSGPEGMEDVRRAMAPTVLKSLLMDSNLAEKNKVQAVKDRALSLKNMETKADRDRVLLSSLPAAVCDEDEEEEEVPRFKKFESERGDLRRGSSRKHHAKGSHGKRQYRAKERSPTGSQYFDKLPSYFTDLPAPKQPGMPEVVSTTKMLVENEDPFPLVDRDPSPIREDPSFSKMPAYFSCFTKSVKYETSRDCVPAIAGPHNPDPLGLNCDDDDNPLVISTSQGPSRAHSRSGSPSQRSNSRSRSITWKSRRQRRTSYSSSSSSCSSSCSCSSSSSSR
jgi:hypothetical protein